MSCISSEFPHTGIFENIVGFNPALSARLVSKTKVLSWLLTRIQSKTHDENRGYAAELLSILLQDNTDNKMEFGLNNGVEIVLKALSVRPRPHRLTILSLHTEHPPSNIVGETLLMQTKLNLWRIYSTLYALL